MKSPYLGGIPAITSKPDNTVALRALRSQLPVARIAHSITTGKTQVQMPVLVQQHASGPVIKGIFSNQKTFTFIFMCYLTRAVILPTH